MSFTFFQINMKRLRRIDILQIMLFPREMVDLRNVACNLKQIENISTNQESSTDEKLKKWKLNKLQNSRCNRRNAEKIWFTC